MVESGNGGAEAQTFAIEGPREGREEKEERGRGGRRGCVGHAHLEGRAGGQGLMASEGEKRRGNTL